MIQRIRQAMRERDEGFTLVELLVVMIIIGILASIAIPVFLGQRQRAYDTEVQSDLKTFATAAESTFTSDLEYTEAVATFSTTGATTPIKSKDTNYVAFVMASGTTAGYVIYGKHKDSGTVFVVSSYNGGAPVKTGLTALPSAAPAANVTYSGVDLGNPSSMLPAAGLSW